MKKIILLCSAVVVFSLVGCGKSDAAKQQVQVEKEQEDSQKKLWSFKKEPPPTFHPANEHHF